MQFPIFSNKNPELKNLADYVRGLNAGGGGSTTTVGAGNPISAPTDQTGDTYWNSTDNNFWVFQNGWSEVLGANGRRTAKLVLYANGASMPLDLPSGTSVYNWLTGVLSEPTQPMGWTVAVPQPVQGTYLWSASVIYTDTDVSNSSDIIWGDYEIVVEAISYSGANGQVGANGNSTYQFPAYYLDTQTPSVPPGTPTGGSWNFGDGNGTAPTGNPATQIWSLTPPGGTGQLYVSYTTASTNMVGTPVTNLTWSNPVAVTVTGARGEDGQSIFLYQVYQVSANTPTTPQGGSWNFGTRVGTPPTGWSNNPMTVTGTDYNWVSQAVAFSPTPGGTWTGDAVSWSVPVRLTGAAGPAGSSPAVVDISGYTALYKDVAGGFTPATVTLTALVAGFNNPTYSWAITGNGIVINTPTDQSSISFSVTTSATLTQANVSLRVQGSAGNDITKTLVLPVVEQGAPGTAGQNGAAAAYPSIYQWTSSTTVPSRPTTTSRFNWSTGILGDAPNNTLNNGWSYTLPANTTPGDYLWELTAPLAATAPLTTTDYNWGTSTLTPRVVSFNGNNGTSGGSGPGSFFVEITGSTARTPTNAEFSAVAGRDPTPNDLCTVQPQSTPGNTTTYRCTAAGNPASWTQVSQYIPGSLIVQNTVTADRLNVSSLSAITANIGTLYMPSSSSADRVVIDGVNNRIDVYNANVLRVRIGNLD